MMLHLLRSLAYVKTFLERISHYELLSEVTLSGLNAALASCYLSYVCTLVWLSLGKTKNILKNFSAVYVQVIRVDG